MKEAAFIDDVPCIISEPPNQSTMAIVAVPKSSLSGWARAWRRAMRLLIR